ncbi:MAG: DUF4954 family protein [Cyclonatronaceae bacterium]
MTYRNLKNDELAILKENGCLAENWDHVLVSDGFQSDRIRNVYFSGRNKLGVFDGSIDLEEGESVRCGIYNSTLRDAVVEDNAFIASVQFLSRYKVEEGAVVRNVGTIAVSRETAFGNGTEISVLNEAGGREVMMYDRMTAQVAAIMATSRHDPQVIANLQTMIRKYAEGRKADCGVIGRGAEVRDSGVLRNIYVGPYARVSNARHLEEVSLVSSKEAPVQVGAGVIARNVIIQSGSTIDTGALLKNCFVGQGVQIGKQFSAEESVFFANSEGFHGEAVSLFAGPYTVSHHKSSLLIAGMCSFINVGSGTNQSNHMYKLGPLHQGILERGVKTGSFSYMGWPSHIGAYTAVIGKHPNSFDASDFPFSYINEMDGKTVVTPAMNLFTVGTRRDSEKWAARDRRKGTVQYDLIRFGLFTPYIIDKVLSAMELMRQLREGASKKQDMVHHKGIHIKRLLLKTCARYYEMAVKIYMGQGLIRRLEGLALPSKVKKLIPSLQYDSSKKHDKWLDVAGMLVPATAYEKLLGDIASDMYWKPQDLEKALADLHRAYDEYAWAHCAALIEKWHGKPVDEWDAELIGNVLAEGRDQAVKFNNMIYHDAKKEFDPTAQIGYGVFGEPEEDFRAVRGELDENKFVTGLMKENNEIAERVEKVIKEIS